MDRVSTIAFKDRWHQTLPWPVIFKVTCDRSKSHLVQPSCAMQAKPRFDPEQSAEICFPGPFSIDSMRDTSSDEIIYP